MQIYWYWWILACIFIGLEMISATLYLLFLAIACALAGLVAWAGFSFWLQCLCALGVTTLSFMALYVRNQRRMAEPNAQENNFLDAGTKVYVAQELWQNQKARVKYRGSDWDAQLEGDFAQDGQYVIVALKQNTLIVRAV